MVNQGDIVIVDFDSSLGSEQKGKRPGVVVSNDISHKKTNEFVIVVPITLDKAFKYPLHVDLGTINEKKCVDNMRNSNKKDLIWNT